MSDRKIVSISPESEKYVLSYATRHDLKTSEAADKLILLAHNRLAALRRYNKNQEGASKKPSAKKPAKKAAAKAATKKVMKKAPKKKTVKHEVNGVAHAAA